MSVEDDLPALRTADLDLPRLAVADRRHEPPLARVHPAWSSHAAQLDVRAVATGPDGDVWLATAGGVLRWRPGLERFTRYGSEHGLPGNGIRAVAVTRDGMVWALADNGTLARLTGDEWTGDERVSVGATCLATSSDEDGSVWTVVGEAVFRLDAAHNAVPLAGGPSHVRALAIRAPADLWAAGAEGVFQYEVGGWRRRLRHRAVTGLLRDERGLWVASARGLEFADLDARSLQVPPGVPRGPATALAPAPGGVWAAVGGIVGRATPDGWAPLPGARRAAVTALAAGPDAQVLIGTREALLRATEQSEPVPHLSDQAPDVVGMEPLGVPSLVQALALQPTAAGATVWLGTTRGLFAFEPALGRWRRVAARRVGDVRALAGGDPLWIGTWRDGLRAFVDGRVGGAAAGIGGPITALAPALAGGAWAGGPNGVYRSDPASSIDDGGGWSRVLRPEDLPEGAWVRSLLDSPDGLWIGTSAGLLRLDGAGLDAPVEGLRDADVRALLLAGDELLAGTARGLYARAAPVAGLEEAEVTALVKWGEAVLVGTADGLYRADNEGGWTARRLANSADSGLAADRVTALAAADGQAWIGTTNGLGCLEG